MGNTDFPKCYYVLCGDGNISIVLYGVVADTVIFLGNIYNIVAGFSYVATDAVGVAVQGMENIAGGGRKIDS